MEYMEYMAYTKHMLYVLCSLISAGMPQPFYVLESAHVAALIRHERKWRSRGEAKARHATVAQRAKTYRGSSQVRETK